MMGGPLCPEERARFAREKQVPRSARNDRQKGKSTDECNSKNNRKGKNNRNHNGNRKGRGWLVGSGYGAYY